jgi:hypothetical protein
MSHGLAACKGRPSARCVAGRLRSQIDLISMQIRSTRRTLNACRLCLGILILCLSNDGGRHTRDAGSRSTNAPYGNEHDPRMTTKIPQRLNMGRGRQPESQQIEQFVNDGCTSTSRAQTGRKRRDPCERGACSTARRERLSRLRQRRGSPIAIAGARQGGLAVERRSCLHFDYSFFAPPSSDGSRRRTCRCCSTRASVCCVRKFSDRADRSVVVLPEKGAYAFLMLADLAALPGRGEMLVVGNNAGAKNLLSY